MKRTLVLTCLLAACQEGGPITPPPPPPAPVSLSVVGAGSEQGVIASTPAGIACTISGTSISGACTASFPRGSSVVLTASPADGTVFGSWGGNCAGSSLSCSLLLEGAASVSATFALGGPGPMKLEAVTVPSNAGIALVTVSGVAITSAVAAPGYQVRVVGTIGGSTQLLIRPVAVDGAIVPGRLVDLQVADRGALSTVVVNQVAARRSAGYAPLEALTLSARVAKP